MSDAAAVMTGVMEEKKTCPITNSPEMTDGSHPTVALHTIFLLKWKERGPNEQNMHGAANVKKKEDRICH